VSAVPLAVDPSAPSPLLDELAARGRELVDATVRTQVDDAALAAARDSLTEALSLLTTAQRSGPFTPVGSRPVGTDAIPYPYNPVLGRGNPLAPPVHVDVIDGELHGTVTCGSAYEGPPGYVHGGVLSLILDQTLGLANLVAGQPGMTVDLQLRYRRPTPLFRPLQVHSAHVRTDGRRIYADGSISVDGQVCVEATGIFASLGREQIQRIFSHLREPT
jgi:acyl-coenzyme A thioesterase PaaI-like protein